MKVQLMGTGGAEGIPALHAHTRVSNHARVHGGKDVRTRSAALVNGEFKLDLGPDTVCQVHRLNLDTHDWTAVFYTHSDLDHLAIPELQYFLYPFDQEGFAMPFPVYGNEHVVQRIADYYPDWPIELHQTESFRPFTHGHFQLTPIQARHLIEEDAQNLILDDGERTLLYATDTGYWAEVTWRFLEKVKLDALVIECTEGYRKTGYDGHLDIELCRAVVCRLREMGTLSPQSIVCTTHHSHNGGATHADLEADLNPDGILVGYDGLCLEF